MTLFFLDFVYSRDIYLLELNNGVHRIMPESGAGCGGIRAFSLGAGRFRDAGFIR